MIEIDNNKMASVLSSFQVPVRPQILIDLQSFLNEDDPDIDNIAVLISSDVGLSSKILKIINSPFYGMNRKISKIKQAVIILGLRTIEGLVTALVLKSSFQGSASIPLEEFWDDSLEVANAMAFIGGKINHKIPIDMLYTIGLFQNCGIPMLALKFSDYNDVLTEASREGENSTSIEDKHYHTNHAVLGYYVASSWNLPREICALILKHHELDYLAKITGSSEQVAFAVLKIAENMVEKLRRHDESADWDRIKEDVFNVLGITSLDYDDLEDAYMESLGYSS